MPTHHPPVGSIHLMYSDNCDKHVLWSAEIINSSEREEYTKVNAFQKDGKGVILFRDNQGNIAFALLCRWVEGQLRGKGYLYDVQQSDFRSIVTFCGNVLVDEVAFYPSICEQGIVDGGDGSRWEGSCYNGEAYGKGLIFSTENEPCHYGTCIHNRRCGFGIVYHEISGDALIPHMEGFWFDDVLYGPVKFFDRHGDFYREAIMIGGEEIDTTFTLSHEMPLRFCSCVKQLHFDDQCGVDIFTVVDLGCCEALEQLRIGNSCFSLSRGLYLIGLRHLRSVEIGRDSFTFCNNSDRDPYEKKMQLQIRSHRRKCLVQNCPLLERFSCKEGSFSSFTSLLLSSLPSLQSLQIGVALDDQSIANGSLCFFWCKELVLSNLPSLEEVVFGNFVFYYCSSLSIESTCYGAW